MATRNIFCSSTRRADSSCNRVNRSKTRPERSRDLRAFIFDRSGKTHVVFWHPSGQGESRNWTLMLQDSSFPGVGQGDAREKINGGVTIPYGDRQYLLVDLPRQEVLSLFRNAKVVQRKRS